MIVLGFDTATPSTAVGLRLADGSTLQVRDDPGPGERPGHATRLLAMTGELLAAAGVGWSAVDRIAVGLGPGTFTGLRVGVATARGLAQSMSVDLVGVSSLQALAEAAVKPDGVLETQAEPAGARRGVLAVIDARRGEAFAAAYAAGDDGSAAELAFPRVLAPADLASVRAKAEEQDEQPIRAHERRWLAVGDGAVRFRGHLENAGVKVPGNASRLHLVSAEAICNLGAGAPAAPYEEILPNYRRLPDAEIALQGAGALEG
jgi:tRNA threonylcarbamoyladenosine biosynthesis protein TsaB